MGNSLSDTFPQCVELCLAQWGLKQVSKLTKCQFLSLEMDSLEQRQYDEEVMSTLKETE